MEHRLPPLEQLGTDLRDLPRARVVLGLAVPPALVGLYGVFAALGWWVPAIACIGAFTFLSYTSVSHDLVHRTLGLSRTTNALALSIIEVLGMRSGTAYRLVHLQHHRAFPAPDDVEGYTAARSLRGALWMGLCGPVLWWRWAYARHPTARRRLVLEATAIAMLVGLSVVALPWTIAPAVYVAFSFAAGLVLPLATAYLPHRAEAADPLHQTRLFRGRLWSILFGNHLFHLEHHLYPAIPHHNWPELGRRLDPHFERLGVRPTRPW